MHQNTFCSLQHPLPKFFMLNMDDNGPNTQQQNDTDNNNNRVHKLKELKVKQSFFFYSARHRLSIPYYLTASDNQLNSLYEFTRI